MTFFFLLRSPLVFLFLSFFFYPNLSPLTTTTEKHQRDKATLGSQQQKGWSPYFFAEIAQGVHGCTVRTMSVRAVRHASVAVLP